MTREQYQVEIQEVTKDFSDIVIETVSMQVVNSWFSDFMRVEGRQPESVEILKFIESEAYLRNFLDYAKEMREVREKTYAEFMNR